MLQLGYGLMFRIRITLSHLRSSNCTVGLVLVSVLVCNQSLAEWTAALIDDRCEQLKSLVSFEERTFRPCDNELAICTKERTAQISEPHNQAEEYCWNRPISIDPRFKGPCPEYMAVLESNKIDNNQGLLQRIWLRNFFVQRDSRNNEIGWLKSSESETEIRRILEDEPNNSAAISIQGSLLIRAKDYVKDLNLQLRRHELDPDCPESRWLYLRTLNGLTKNVVDSWLTGRGSGAELSKTEMEEIFFRVQRTLLEAYDLAIEQSEKEEKLRWALESVHDGILSRYSENVQRVASLIDAGSDDYVEKRSTSLIQRFSHEYDVDSEHGRSLSLRVACSNHAFELGLLDHCLKLLTYFAREDSNSLDSPALDWTRAAISVMNALTRDCSPANGWILHAPDWWNDRRCLEEQHAVLTTNISELLGRFSNRETSAEANVLEAYLHMAESSDEWFLRALEMNDAMVVYAAPLSKRLHRMGYLGTATNILSGIDVEIEGKLTSGEKQLLNQTSSSVLEGIYKNWIESLVDF